MIGLRLVPRISTSKFMLSYTVVQCNTLFNFMSNLDSTTPIKNDDESSGPDLILPLIEPIIHEIDMNVIRLRTSQSDLYKNIERLSAGITNLFISNENGSINV